MTLFVKLNNVISLKKINDNFQFTLPSNCSNCNLFNDINIISLLAKMTEQWH